MSTARTFPWLGLIVVVLLGGLAAGYWWMSAYGSARNTGETSVSEIEYIPPVESVVEEPVYVAEPKGEVEPRVPAPAVKPKPVLPLLRESDDALKRKLKGLPDGTALLALLVNDELIRKAVRMTHGLSEGFVVKEFRPFASPQTRFSVADTGERTKENESLYVISPENAERYATYISVLNNIDAKDAAALYHYFSPLLQQAYEELGLREPDFSKVTHKALKVLLAESPTYAGELRLRQPSVMYIYDDAALESRSGVDKLKLRMGPSNTQSLHAWLGEFQKSL